MYIYIYFKNENLQFYFYSSEVPTFSQCKVHIEAAIKDKDLLLPEEENEIDLGTSNENGEEIAGKIEI